MLSNTEDRKLYDRLGHNAFVKNGASSDPEEEQGRSFDDIFQFFEDDFMWSFPDENAELYTFHAQEFTYVFSDGDEYEEDNYF